MSDDVSPNLADAAVNLLDLWIADGWKLEGIAASVDELVSLRSFFETQRQEEVIDE